MNNFEKARFLTRRRFGNTIQMYAPLYLSNECVDTCTYCGFSFLNKIPRKTLTVEEVLSEARHLRSEGFRHLLLVSGEHPLHVSQGYLETVVKNLRPEFASLSIEVAPFREENYRRLIEAGLDGVVIYQETYDPNRYAAVHLSGPKKDYAKRLAAPEEAAKAGIRSLGMGILLGLADWRKEADALIRHVRELQKRYWQTEFTVSLPRLRPSASEWTPPHPVSDREFVELVATFRIALPEVGIVLSTRESPELRNQLIGLGVTHMSAGSRTEPGGYLNPDKTLKQFETEDHRTAADVAAIIRQKGYEPVWKDNSPLPLLI